VPGRAAQHWQRGIAYYYAGRYEDGRKQFELHQTVNPHDVENAVWHFLCVAKLSGVEKARSSLIPITGDGRVPMMHVQALFAGKGTVEDVFAAARVPSAKAHENEAQLFYANLYAGLYYEALGKDEQAVKFIRTAVKDYPSDHYMGDVGRVDLLLRERGKERK
jgi:lipoprotein NlpI